MTGWDTRARPIRPALLHPCLVVGGQNVLEESHWVEPDRLGYLDELEEVQTALAALILGDVRLRAVQARDEVYLL